MHILQLFLLSSALQVASAASTRSAAKSQLRLYQDQTQRFHLGPPRATAKVRAQALAKSARVVNDTNAAHAAGTKSYFLRYNELSDFTDEQYQAFLTARPDKESRRWMHVKKQSTIAQRKRGKQVTFDLGLDRDVPEVENIKVPIEMDWTSKDGGKYMTPVKNQGTCGSCWAFAGVAAIESRVAIEKNVPAVPLSVEQVLSCSGELDHIQSKFYDKMTSSSEGCLGGMPFLTYAYLQLTPPHGIACEKDVPYAMATNETSSQCPIASMDVSVAWKSNVSDYKVVASSEIALLQAVTTGPVTANIDAGGNGFRHYGGGIYDAQDCRNDGDEVNHAVVIVGFGETRGGEKYWLLRNTWGTMWGEDGYMRIARGNKVGFYGPCNLYLYADYPVNLTLGPHATTCGASVPTFKPLSFMKLIALSSPQVGMLLLCTGLSVLAGIAFFYGTEMVQNRKQTAAGELCYEDAYARWIVPTRDQLATALAHRTSRRVHPPATN